MAVKEKEVILKALTIANQKCIPWPVIRNQLDDVHLRHEINGIVVGLYAHIAEQENERITCRYPANWIEAVKERFAPKWLLNHYPVIYEERHLVASYLYPNIQFPDSRAVHFPIVREDR